ncbi:MAG: hypothetical protein ACRDZO_13035 [Egibacteraceae bacterium]
MTGTSEVSTWLTAHLPGGWFVEAPEIQIDRDEVLVIGRLEDAGGDEACLRCIERFREATRDHRIRVAVEAERQFGRKVSWGARCGDVCQLFTILTVPAMTRLRFAERAVLDTLIDAGVARSRSDALAWCVRLVGANQSEWLDQLREAFQHVQRVRAAGPKAPVPD